MEKYSCSNRKSAAKTASTIYISSSLECGGFRGTPTHIQNICRYVHTNRHAPSPDDKEATTYVIKDQAANQGGLEFDEDWHF